MPDAALRDMDLADCLRLALRRNRSLRRTELSCRASAAERGAVWRNLIGPALSTSYALEDTVDDGERTAAGGAAALAIPLRYGGFVLEPSIELSYEHEDMHAGYDPDAVLATEDLVDLAELAEDKLAAKRDNYGTSIGLALSRRLLRRHEHIAQRLPVDRVERGYAVAVNRRLLEMRELRLAVTRAYFDLIRLRRRLEIRRLRVADAKAFLATVEAKVANGFAAPVQATNAAISLSQAEADLLAERTALQEGKEALLRLFGLAIHRRLNVRAEPVPEQVALPADLEADIALVRDRHERVHNHLMDMEILRRECLVAADQVRPDLTAILRLSEEREADGFFAGEEVQSAELELTLTAPLDGFAAERADALTKRLQLRRMALQLADLRDDLEAELRRHYRRLERWRRTARLLTSRVTAERDRLSATLERYEAGEIDNLEVTRAKEALDNAELSLLQARIEQVLAASRYQAMLPAAGDDDAGP